MSGANDLICPTDPNHGELYGSRDNKDRFYCAHSDHLGRGPNHPAGRLEPASPFFTYAEVVAANARYAAFEPSEELEVTRVQVSRSTPGARARAGRAKPRAVA